MWLIDLAKKGLEKTKKVGIKIKEKLTPLWGGAKKSARYLWHITQEGAARGHALLKSTELSLGKAALSKSVNYSVIGLHSFLSFAKRFWKESSSEFMKKVAFAAKSIQSATKSMPLLVTLGIGLGLLEPTALLALLCLGGGLSLTKFSFKKLKEHAKKNQIHNLTTKCIEASHDYILEPLLNILIRGGQGAFLQEIIKDLLASYDSETAEKNSWLLLLIIVPMLLECIRYPLVKNKNHNKAVREFSTAIVAAGAAEETFGYNTVFLAQLIADYADGNSDGTITDNQAIAVFSIAAVLGITSGFIKAITHKKKLLEVNNQLDYLSEHGVNFDNHNSNDGHSVIELTDFSHTTSTTHILQQLDNLSPRRSRPLQELCIPLLVNGEGETQQDISNAMQNEIPSSSARSFC